MTSEFNAAYTEYQTNRSGLRKWVRKLYLESAARQLQGPTLDFGCGVGELLERLPAGSRGLEYNEATVKFCREKGLQVDSYDGFTDGWQLSTLPTGAHFESMVISHVLEHLDQPTVVLSRLLDASAKLAVRRVLVIVPGRAGFALDPTHRTFIDLAMLSNPELTDNGFRLCQSRYFPGNSAALGNAFPHHELQVLYQRD